MTHGQQILFLILALAHTVLSVIGTRLIVRSKMTSTQKGINILLLWSIPVFWYILVKTMTRRTPGSHEVTEKKHAIRNNPYESGLGAPGSGIGNRGL